MKRSPPKRDTYQHGNLAAALSETVLELVAEKGVKNFSLAEAARRSGVSSGAPYRHFSSREELLADVSATVYQDLVERLRSARLGAKGGVKQVAAVVKAYVDFAVNNRPGVEVLFQSGVSHADYPALAKLDAEAYAEYRAAADETGLDEAAAHDLVFASAALAHGFAMLQVAASAAYEMTGDVAGQKASDAVERTVEGFIQAKR